jgi:hypothetical protein
MTTVRGSAKDIRDFITDPDGLRAQSERQIAERTNGYDEPIDGAVLRAALLLLDRHLAGSPSDTLGHHARDALEQFVARAYPEAMPWPLTEPLKR